MIKNKIIGGLAALTIFAGCETFEYEMDYSPWETPRTPIYFLKKLNQRNLEKIDPITFKYFDVTGEPFKLNANEPVIVKKYSDKNDNGLLENGEYEKSDPTFKLGDKVNILYPLFDGFPKEINVSYLSLTPQAEDYSETKYAVDEKDNTILINFATFMIGSFDIIISYDENGKAKIIYKPIKINVMPK